MVFILDYPWIRARAQDRIGVGSRGIALCEDKMKDAYEDREES